MAASFHRWTRDVRVEPTLNAPLLNDPSGFSYTVTDSGGMLYQVERLPAAPGRPAHELRRRIDYVMGSGSVARTYFTEENGRLFQLPLTWYRSHGWDFSPGYEVNNARFDRMLPNRCLACHASYPDTLPHLEGKYATLRPGIGCERCHGPGALHVAARSTSTARDTAFDATIVNPRRMSLARRMDSCEQCHVHTAVTVLREGRTDFSYMPSQPLRDQAAVFTSGGIDIVSHADRLRQSACFIASRVTVRPLECATCHNPHAATPVAHSRNAPCQTCHLPPVLAKKFAGSSQAASHAPASDCVSCHMPRTDVRQAVHGAFTDHWIRVPGRDAATATTAGTAPIAAYFERDKTGPDARIYQGMGQIVYATLANNAQVMGDGAAVLDSALGADATHAYARFLLGVAYQQLLNGGGAVQALEQSVRADSARPEALRALAMAYAAEGRDATTIDPLYRRALTLQPALAWIRAEHADFLLAHGRVDEAERAYRAAVAEQPSLAGAWFNLGALLAGGGRTREADDAFRAAVHLDPSLADALSPLFEIRGTTASVTHVRASRSSRPGRSRAFSAAVMPSQVAIVFARVPARTTLQIFTPDGTIVRELSASADGTAEWDLLTSANRPVASGLYRVRAGRNVLSLGIARAR